MSKDDVILTIGLALWFSVFIPFIILVVHILLEVS